MNNQITKKFCVISDDDCETFFLHEREFSLSISSKRAHQIILKTKQNHVWTLQCMMHTNFDFTMKKISTLCLRWVTSLHREDLKNLWRQLLMKSILILYSRYYNFEIIMICSRVHRCVKLISFPLETFLYSNTNWWRPTSSKMNDI